MPDTPTDGLNPDQLDAVVHGGGPLLVVAGAGSGKTRVLTHRIAHLIDEGVHPGRILAITFTNKAADEMRQRVEALVGPVVRSMWVSTFHSACVRILRANADRLGYPRQFSIYDQADAVRLTGYVIRDLALDAKRFPPRGVHAVISLWKNELVDPDAAAARAENIFDRKRADVYREYQARLHKAGAMDFDDLLVNTVRLFRDHPDVLESYRERFEHILVDEYQDTNQSQNEIVLMLAGGHQNVTVVGDTDQSVYRFRGADYRNILQFEDAFPEVTTVVLDQNYRSTQNILDAANAVIANNVSRKPKNLWTDAGRGDLVVRYWAEDEGDEATFVARQSIALHDDGRAWRDLAVLYRTNAQSRVVEEAMMRLGVPYKVVGGTRFYDRREVKDAMAYLRAVVNPADEVSLKRVLNVPKRGVGDASVAKLDSYAAADGVGFLEALRRADDAGVSGPATRGIASFVALLDRLGELATRADEDGDPATERAGPGDLLQAALEESGYLAELEAEDTVESAGRLENLAELVGSAREFTRLDEFLEQVSLVADTDELPDGEVDDQVVAADAALRQGARVPGGVPDRGGGRGVPARPRPHRARRAGGGTAPRLRRDHQGQGAVVRHPRLEPQPVRLDAVQPPSRFLEEIPDELVEAQGNVTGRSAYGRQSLRPRVRLGIGRAPPYRRRGRGPGAADQRRADVHRERVVEAAIAAGQRPGSGGPDAHDLGLQIGDDVEHPAFGEGVVIDLRGHGEEAEATVNFAGVGTKHLALAFAPLRKR